MGCVMLDKLIKLANDLDKAGLYKEADTIDEVIKEANLAYLLPSLYMSSEHEGRENVLDWSQAALNAIGLIPGLGEAADLANIGISSWRKDPVGVILSAISMIPTIGDIIGKSAKVFIWATKKGLKSIKVGADLYDVTSVGQFVLEQLNQHSEGIEKILNSLDEQAGVTSGHFKSLYNEKVLPLFAA